MAAPSEIGEGTRLSGSMPTLDDYLALGGGDGLAVAHEMGPEAVIDEVRRAGLRGRGGAGFPTAVKWEAVSRDACPTKYLVCNAAEGEPGTFKDRFLMRRNPYQLIEGIAIAAFAVGAQRAYIGTKSVFRRELDRLRKAIDEMQDADLLGPIPIEIVEGPDAYTFGEEKALLEVIEGNDPSSRVLLPFEVGLFATIDSPNPTVVNNVETLSNVGHIVRNGAPWFRLLGTDTSPGTMLFTVSGDVDVPGVYELPLGTPLRVLVQDIAGGPRGGRRIKAIMPGASNMPLRPEHLDTPMDFDSLARIGSGLGSGGFVVYDDSACIVTVLLEFSRFLYVESCGVCLACKLCGENIVDALARIEGGKADAADLLRIDTQALEVTGGRRCALPLAHATLVQGALRAFLPEFERHVGRTCPLPRKVLIPRFLDYDEKQGRFTYDEHYRLKQPNWAYLDEPAAAGV